MRHHLTFIIAALVAVRAFADPVGDEFFEKKVRPLFVEQCGKCHSAQAEKVKGGLRLDSRTEILKGGDTGPLFVPGDPEKSLLMTAVRYADKDLRMPPPAKDGADRKLTDAQIADLAEWVKMGAPIPQALVSTSDPSKHWAFQSVTNPPVPEIRNPKSEIRNPIDAFILAKLEKESVTPAPPADARTLLRRITYDLTGLPPTPEEMEAFVAAFVSHEPSAISDVIDRLLASPAYGEKWGRKWLDVVRYADSAGDNSDYPSPHAWRYRNYVIDAFNRDLPYDQFVREQLAGDILAASQPRERYAECVTATGYLAIARRFGGARDDPDFYLTIEDTIDTLGKSVLGLTLGCARCHNHKYDPVTSRDFYGLYGIFSSTRYTFPGNEEGKRSRDLVPLVPPAEVAANLKPWEAELAKLDGELKRLEGELAEKRKTLPASVPVAIAEGDVPNTEVREIVERTVQMKAGEMLQLTILPKTNHGADSTQLELEIAESGGTRTWSLSRDVVEHFTEEANGTRFGPWSLLDTTPGPALFTRLERDVVNTKGLHHWQGAGDFPVVTAYAGAAPVKIINAVFAPRSVVVHPAPAGNVAVAWECPTDGAFVVKGRVIDIDPGGGDGVAWRLEQRPGIAAALTELFVQSRALGAAKKQRDEFAAKRPPVDMAYAVVDGKVANARIQKRGEPKDLGDEVPRKNIDLLGGQLVPPDGGSGRAQLAAWVTDPKNPLTARVMVNRIWLGHFGRGLVATPNDFGTRGAPPTHPELLDWLATKFIESGWSVKAMHRLIMASAAYQQAGEYSPIGGPAPIAALNRGNTPGAAAPPPAADPAPQPADSHTSFPRRRLDAEELRDTLLALSGELDRAPGAGHPFPAEDTWSFSQHNPFKAVYDSQKRSVYLMTQRIQRHPYLALFDGADTNASTPSRSASTVPTQALWFLNNPFVHARAEAFAKRLLPLPDDTQRLALAYRLCLQRAPTDAESQSASAFLAAYQAELTNLPPDQRPLAAWSAYSRVLLSSNELLHLD